MRLQLAGRTTVNITADAGELLPHLLTLAPKQVQSGYFLLRYHTLTSIFRQEVQCSVLSGLSSVKISFKQRQNDRLLCKDTAKNNSLKVMMQTLLSKSLFLQCEIIF